MTNRRQVVATGIGAMLSLATSSANSASIHPIDADKDNTREADVHHHMQDRLLSFKRISLLDGPTPIQRLSRLERSLDLEKRDIRVFVKRDDLGLGAGGNKLRKLEFLIGEALAQGCDTFITVGGLQSNHARLSAASAARNGLACELVLTRNPERDDDDHRLNGNILLDALFGATVHTLPSEADRLAFAHARAAELERAGKRVYVVRSGGSTPVGGLGYAACASEILTQERELGTTFSRLFLPNGGAGTHGGLAAGYKALGRDPTSIESFTVIVPAGKAIDETHELASATLKLIEAGMTLSRDEIRVDGSQLAPGYGVPTEQMFQAVRLMARSEGLLLDPVYSGKAFAGMLRKIQDGDVKSGERVLFVMTGGSPALYAYRRSFEAAL